MPCGRPPAPRSIVNINEVLTASQIIQENCTIALLAQSMPNTWKATGNFIIAVLRIYLGNPVL